MTKNERRNLANKLEKAVLNVLQTTGGILNRWGTDESDGEPVGEQPSLCLLSALCVGHKNTDEEQAMPINPYRFKAGRVLGIHVSQAHLIEQGFCDFVTEDGGKKSGFYRVGLTVAKRFEKRGLYKR